MNISLRKASAIQNAINDTVKGIQFNVQVKLNEFQDAEAEISRASAELKTNMRFVKQLVLQIPKPVLITSWLM